MATNGLPVKKKALDKVRRQLADLSALVDLWWQGCGRMENNITLTPQWTSGIEQVLLPLHYWREAVSRTSCPRRKAKLRQALEAVQTALTRTLSPNSSIPMCLRVGSPGRLNMTQAFSAGLLGNRRTKRLLSQMHHNHRGLPQRRSPVWTLLYNFDCRASDGHHTGLAIFQTELSRPL